MNHTWIWLGFAVVFGAVFGSFINVVIYRLPAGISLMNPRFSFCPKCRHSIAWWENIPVLAWFYLRGKCSSCRQPISPIYPIIESLTAAMFGLVFWAFYLSPFRHADFSAPGSGLAATWPILLVYLTLLIGMIAATVIDAKLYIIPLQIPWFVTAVAVVVLPVGLYLVPGFYPLFRHGWDNSRADFYYLMIAPQAVDIWLGAAIGGAAGWLLALILLHTHVIPQSFSDDEAAHDAAVKHPHVPSEVAPLSDAPPLAAPADAPPLAGSTILTSDSSIAAPAAMDNQSPATTTAAGDQPSPPPTQMPAPTVMAASAGAIPAPPATPPAPPSPAIAAPETSTPPAPSAFAVATATVPDPLQPPEAPETPKALETPQSPPGQMAPPAGHDQFVSPVPQNPEELDAWLSHPHLMREIAKECLFVAFPLIGFALGALLYHHVINPVRPPLIPGWAQILGGVVCGYLVGGGLIWIIRIVGTFAFRKEAMGLGDIHLLAAMGAVMGATDATLIFFLAPFLGLAYAACVLGLNRLLKGQIRIIPYGPFLAITAVLVMIFEKAIWMKLGRP